MDTGSQRRKQRIVPVIAVGGTVIGLAVAAVAAVMVAQRGQADTTPATLDTARPNSETELPGSSAGSRVATSPRARTSDEPDATLASAATIVEVTPVTIHARHAAMVEHFERIFRDQVRAETWADAREREFREFFATKPEATGSRLMSADCRSSLCRLRIAHNEPTALSRFEGFLGLYPPFTVAGARFPDPDADHSVLFLAREDTLLPWPDPATLPPTELH